MMDAREFGALVEARLDAFADDLRPWPEWGSDAVAELSFDDYCLYLDAFLEVKRGRSSLTELEAHYPERVIDGLPGFVHYLGRIWPSRGDELADRSTYEQQLEAGKLVALQRFREQYITSKTWRREIAAACRADGWVAIGAEYEAAGLPLQANAALATARWLDPATAEVATTITRGRDLASLPQRLFEQPEPGFRERAAESRRDSVLRMRSGGRIDVASLITYSCDENLWVRRTLYRSLGLQPMLAVVPILLEALLDADSSARARASEALGWTAAPSALAPLQRLASGDASLCVRRDAQRAAQRIAAYWIFYGEWKTIVRSPRRQYDIARQLVARRLPWAAADLIGYVPVPPNGISLAEHEALTEQLKLLWKPLDDYEHTSGETLRQLPPSGPHKTIDEVESAILQTDPVDEPDDMQALYAVSKKRMNAERAIALASAPGALGWNARRALRALHLTAVRPPPRSRCAD